MEGQFRRVGVVMNDDSLEIVVVNVVCDRASVDSA